MYRAIPVANRALAKKWQKREQMLHRQRLTRMRSAVDNKPPKGQRHIITNAKKQQLDEEKYMTIERDNHILMEKISSIMTKSGYIDNHLERHGHLGTLNRQNRRRELMRITNDNLNILRRIQSQKPLYNKAEFDEHAKRHAHYVKALATVESPRPKTSAAPRRRRRKAARAKSSSGVMDESPSPVRPKTSTL